MKIELTPYGNVKLTLWMEKEWWILHSMAVAASKQKDIPAEVSGLSAMIQAFYDEQKLNKSLT